MAGCIPMDLLAHYERFLGPLSTALPPARTGSGVGLCLFKDTPSAHIVTSVTLGLSVHTLEPAPGFVTRVELLFAAHESLTPAYGLSLLDSLAARFLSSHRAPKRGDVIDVPPVPESGVPEE